MAMAGERHRHPLLRLSGDHTDLLVETAVAVSPTSRAIAHGQYGAFRVLKPGSLPYVMAPPFQRSEPLENPGRFRSRSDKS